MRPTKTPRLRFERLEDRLTPATQATFFAGLLTVTGDDTDNTVVVSADPAGQLVVTDGGTPVPIRAIFSTPTRANLRVAVVRGLGGNDSLTLDATLNTPTRSPVGLVYGGAGEDILVSQVGGGVIDGGDGNDELTSSPGIDIVSGGAGDDILRLGPDAGSDVVSGGDGFDNVVLIGADSAADELTATAAGGVVFLTRTGPDPFLIATTGAEQLTVQTLGGDDRVTVNDLRGTGVQLVVVDAGDGDDVIDGGGTDPDGSRNAGINLVLLGGQGADSLTGGAGDDVLDGGDDDDILLGYAGIDTILGGGGNDDMAGHAGADFLDGGDGSDRLNPAIGPNGDGVEDVLIGGAGADLFFFYPADEVPDNVVDFRPDEGDLLVDGTAP